MKRIDNIAECAFKVGIFLVRAYAVYVALRNPQRVKVEQPCWIVTDPDCEVEYDA